MQKEFEAKNKQIAAENKGVVSKEAKQKAMAERDRALAAELAHQEQLAQKQIAIARETAAREQQEIDRDARSDAIKKELEALEKQKQKVDERSALMQQGGANLVDTINTAFGAFKVAQPGAQQELVTSVNKQIALNERIAKLQEEQKRIADETKRSIDEIKMSLKGTVR
jgi:hypothetical protein